LLRRYRRRGGFTLTELMFALSVATITATGIVTTYIFCLKGFKALANYTEMNTAGRRAVDLFSKDVRMAYTIKSFNATNLVLWIPTSVSNAGGITGSNRVTHSFANSSWTRADANAGTTKTLADNITSLQFSLYDLTNGVTTNTASARRIQVNAQLERTVISVRQSQSVLSARLNMRNVS
jgi:prepilin-type N-terminal cleavage/methylation domain-containing protein